jgi:hypothetical protein
MTADRLPGCTPPDVQPTAVANHGEKVIEVAGRQPRIDAAYDLRVKRCCAANAIIFAAEDEIVPSP